MICWRVQSTSRSTSELQQFGPRCQQVLYHFNFCRDFVFIIVAGLLSELFCRDFYLFFFSDFSVGSRYGYSCQRGRVTTAVNALESLPVMFSILQENDSGLICRRRGKFQPRCPDFECEACRVDIISCMGLNKAYILGIVAQSLLLQLPLRDRHALLTRGYGIIEWDDVDWDKFFNNDYGKIATSFILDGWKTVFVLSNHLDFVLCSDFECSRLRLSV